MLLIHDLYKLLSAVTEGYRYAVLITCTHHHEQLIRAGLILNFAHLQGFLRNALCMSSYIVLGQQWRPMLS